MAKRLTGLTIKGKSHSHKTKKRLEIKRLLLATIASKRNRKK